MAARRHTADQYLFERGPKQGSESPPHPGTAMDFTLLHTGAEHPDLTLLVLTGILSFAAGTGLGAYAALRGKVADALGETAEN
ncbi:hypothetical protein [Halalkalicoccus paucihalophilus]|nr:hypothetical protein [Halalkalicoccus paucihalophilus]